MKLLKGNWVRESEHIVFRLASLVFSVGSAYLVRGFFEPLDAGDPVHYVLWWIVSGAFGLLGFYLSRGLAHRMMSKESIWIYAPIFALIEFFEILCNYTKAVSVVGVGQVPWIAHAPPAQQPMMVVLTYVGWSILPLVSPAIAVIDMDLTRHRNGEVAEQRRSASPKQPSVGAVYQQGYPATQAGSRGQSPQPVVLKRPAQPPQPPQVPARASAGMNGSTPSPGVQVIQ